MVRNTHFALATHVLAALALHEGGPVTSAQLAKSVGTNPAFLRTLLGQLREAGLIRITLGKGGGAELARPPSETTLADVFDAVVDQPPITKPRCKADGACVVGRNMGEVLDTLNSEVESAVHQVLAQTTVAALAKKLKKLG